MKYVLIVDDQRMPRENMERIINESDGYQLVMSLSAAEFAPLQCERSHVDLVLMDVCTQRSIGNVPQHKFSSKSCVSWALGT